MIEIGKDWNCLELERQETNIFKRAHIFFQRGQEERKKKSDENRILVK